MFDITITLVIQLVNFVVAIVGLNYLLIKPIRAIVKKRRDFASGMLTDAETFTSDAAKKLMDYESALTKAREEAAAARDTYKSEGSSREAELLETAHAEAQSLLLSSRESTRMAIIETRSAMEQRVPELAAMVVARLIGKPKRSSAA